MPPRRSARPCTRPNCRTDLPIPLVQDSFLSIPSPIEALELEESLLDPAMLVDNKSRLGNRDDVVVTSECRQGIFFEAIRRLSSFHDEIRSAFLDATQSSFPRDDTNTSS